MWPYGFAFLHNPYSSGWALAQENAELRDKVSSLQRDLAGAHTRRPSTEDFVYVFCAKNNAYRVRGTKEACEELGKLLRTRPQHLPEPENPEQRIDALEAMAQLFSGDYSFFTPTGLHTVLGTRDAVAALAGYVRGLHDKLVAAKAALEGK